MSPQYHPIDTLQASMYTQLQYLQQKSLELSANAQFLEMRLHQAVLSLNEQKQKLRAAYDQLSNEYHELEKERWQLQGALDSALERDGKYRDQVQKLKEENELLRRDASLARQG